MENSLINQSNMEISYFAIFWAKNHWFRAKFHFFHFSQLFYKVFDKFWDENGKFNKNKFWGIFWGHKSNGPVQSLQWT